MTYSNKMRVAVIVPAFPILIHTYTYTRVGSLGARGSQVNLFYSNEGNADIFDTKLVKRMLNAGVTFSRLPNARLSLHNFLGMIFKKESLIRIKRTISYIKRMRQKNSLRRSVFYLLRFAPLLFWQPDVIHIESSYLVHGMLDGLEGIGIPIVISLRGSDVDKKPKYSKKWINFYQNAKDRPLICFHCVSNYIKKKAVGLGVPQQKCEVIYQGLSIDNKPLEQIINKQLDEIKKIIIIARLDPEKGVDLAIKCLALLNNVNSKLKLEIFGTGSEEANLQGMIKKLDIQKYIHFHGLKKNNYVRSYLEKNATQSIYLQPSRSEAFGQSIIEAMAAGLPVVATRVGGIPEIITDGENGLLCKPLNPEFMADNILRIINDPQLRTNLQQNAFFTVKNRFSEAIEAKNFIDYYDKLTNRKE